MVGRAFSKCAFVSTPKYSPELVRGRLEAELGAGAGLLQKPYDADTLGRKVREVLDAVRRGGGR